MINGPLIHGKLRDAKNSARHGVTAGKTPDEIVEHLYLAALCRKPSAAGTEGRAVDVPQEERRPEARHWKTSAGRF